MTLVIECDNANIDTSYYNNQIRVGLLDVNLSFLNDINEDEIIKHYDNQLLFEKLIENDEDLLHSYLTANGYIFNKA